MQVFSYVLDKNSLEVLSTRRQKLSQDCNFDNSHMHVYDSIVLSFLRMDEELHYQLISWHFSEIEFVILIHFRID